MRTISIILVMIFAAGFLGCTPGGGDGPVCGDGVLEGDEECDDGNTFDNDGCSSACLLPVAVCGDNTIDPGEQCDDGNTTSGDGCDATCQVETGPRCGNGIIEVGEGCDDGNTTPGDGCDDFCRSEYCGNGLTEDPEECDDGNDTAGDGCDPDCFNEECGNGRIDFGEECDGIVPDTVTCETLGGYGGHVSCLSDCTYDDSTCGFCGDGVNDGYPNESCDDGNAVSGDGCESDCTPTNNYCITDGNLGTFGAGTNSTFSANTGGGRYAVKPVCGGNPGAERVYSLTFSEDVDFDLSVTSADYPHAVAIYTVGGTPDTTDCDAGTMVSCQEMTGGDSSTYHLSAGDYYIVVDALDATSMGLVNLSFTVAAMTVVLDEGFESCSLPAGWTMNGGIWEVGSASTNGPSACDAGSCCVGTDFSANYPSSMGWGDHCVTTGNLSIPVASVLTFRSWMYTETSFDGGIIEVFSNGTWADPPSIDPAYQQDNGGRMTWAGSYQAWATHTIDMNSYAGQTVQLRWCFFTDGSVTYPGWYIDSIFLQ